MVRKLCLSACILLLVIASVNGQYLETFSTPNKGYLLNNANDFSGVSWTLSPWSPDNTTGTFAGRDIGDFFSTSAGGKLEAIDLDHEVYWESPLLNISTAGTVGFSVDLTWDGFDNDIAGNPCSSGAYGTVASLDAIKVMYSINGGAYVLVPTTMIASTCATIGYANGNGTNIAGFQAISQSGISGSNLRIRIIVNTNSNAEIVTIDNVRVPQAGVTIACNTPAVAPPEVQVTNSTCNTACTAAGGSILAPAGSPCPSGFTLQYQVNGGAWSSTLPVYAQSGPAQTIKTRCSCDANTSVTGPISAGVTTVPASCVSPVVTAPSILQPTCTAPTGRIIVRATGASTMEYSIDNGATYKLTASFPNLAPGNYFIKVRFQASPNCVTTYSANPVVINPVPPTPTWYLDADGDGYYGSSQSSCTSPGTGWTSTPPSGGGGDCNDDPLNGGAAINPGVAEICNGIDDNCSGSIDEGLPGCGAPTVTAPTVTQPTCLAPLGRIIVRATGTSTMEYSIDSGRTYKSTASFPNLSPGSYFIAVRYLSSPLNPAFYAANPVVINPPPITPTWYWDLDNDGYFAATQAACTSPGTGWTTTLPPGGGGDCNDDPLNGGAAINPGAIEICNGIDDNCNGWVDDGTIVLVAPTAITGPDGVCRLSTNQVFSVAPVPGATSYEWILPNGATGSSTTNTISLSFSSSYITGNLCVKAKNACGESASFCRSVKYYGVKPGRPVAIFGKTIGTCTSETYYVDPVVNTTSYNWTVPANASIVSGQGTASVVVSFTSAFSTGTLSVTASNCMGASAARTLALSRNPATPASITGPTTEVCGGSTQTYSCPAVIGATSYLWTVPSGAIINSGQGTTSVSVTFPANFLSGNVTVAAYTSCSNSTARSLAVRSKPALPAAITGPAAVCPQAVGLQYSTTPVAGVTYNWVVPSGATITSGQGTASIVVNWGTISGIVKVAAVNACGSSSFKTLSVSLLTCPAPPPVIIAKSEEVMGTGGLSVNLWPNPARDVLMVTLDEFVPNQKMELTLMQADGKVQQAQSLVPAMKGQQVKMDISRAAGGYYILAVKQSGKMINRQVVIVR